MLVEFIHQLLQKKSQRLLTVSKHPSSNKMEYEQEEETTTESNDETLPSTIDVVEADSPSETHHHAKKTNLFKGPLHAWQQWTQRRRQARDSSSYSIQLDQQRHQMIHNQLQGIQPILDSLKRQLRQVTAQIDQQHQRMTLHDHNPFFPNMHLLAHNASLEHRRTTIRLAMDYVQGLALEWQCLLDELKENASDQTTSTMDDYDSSTSSILASAQWSCSQQSVLLPLPGAASPGENEESTHPIMSSTKQDTNNQSAVVIDEVVDLDTHHNSSSSSSSSSSSTTISLCNAAPAKASLPMPSLEQVAFHVETLQKCPPQHVDDAICALRQVLTGQKKKKKNNESTSTTTGRTHPQDDSSSVCSLASSWV